MPQSSVLRRNVDDANIMLENAHHVYIKDKSGKSYLDGISGAMVSSLGYGNEEIIDVISSQAKKLSYSHNARFTNETQEYLASQLSSLLANKYKKKDIIKIAGAYDGLSAKLIEKAGFDAIWSSGFCISASYGLPDMSILTMTNMLERATMMRDVVSIPIIADCDSGFGNVFNAVRATDLFCKHGIEAICIEDKTFPKLNSYIEAKQELKSIAEYTNIIHASGCSLSEIIERAIAYSEAGADCLIIQSKKTDTSELKIFIENFTGKIPIFVIPTTYPKSNIKMMKDLGIKGIIYANQALRASTKATISTLQKIIEEGTTELIKHQINFADGDILERNDNDLLIKFCSTLGNILPRRKGNFDKASGNLIGNVVFKTDITNSEKLPTQTSDKINFHTAKSIAIQRPNIFCMYMADTGWLNEPLYGNGESRLLLLDDILSEYHEVFPASYEADKEILKVTNLNYKPWYIDDSHFVGPILFEENGKYSFRFWENLAETLDLNNLDEKTSEVLLKFNHLVINSKRSIEFQMEKGDILFINNNCVAHGRYGFKSYEYSSDYGYGYAPKGSTQGGYECNQLYGRNDKEVKDIMNILLEKTKDIKRHLLNVSIASIYELDDLILKLDGTDNKSNLPGNLTLAISTAGFYALSHSLNVKPFKLLEQNSDTLGKTSFMFNLLDGIKKSPTSGLECLLIPKLMDSWEDIILKSNKIFATFEKLFIARFNSQPHISEKIYTPSDKLDILNGITRQSILKVLIDSDDSLISQLRAGGSPLQGHPDERFLHLLNYSSGSLGLNTSTGVGMALGMKKKKYDNKVFIIVGDGELQEGQVWESFMFASHYQLDNLVYIVDNNSLQLDGKVSDVMSLGDLKSKIKAFGLDCFEVKGHDYVELNTALCIESKSPKCIIANTIKGKGVPEMENVVEWHSIHDPELAKKVIKKALESIPEICVLDGDCSRSTKSGIFKKHYPADFYNVGIAEQNMVGIAAVILEDHYINGGLGTIVNSIVAEYKLRQKIYHLAISSFTETGDYNWLLNKIDYIIGVPAKELSNIFALQTPKVIITPREDDAVALACGLALGNNRVIVAMQSSGLGNCLNALTSLVIPCDIKFMILISVRGGLTEENDAQRILGEKSYKILSLIAKDIEFIKNRAQYKRVFEEKYTPKYLLIKHELF
ncbi:unnamed protein product [Rotaria sp. Silwood1]|nr:unnamed protein product [Rotaria sp. Silwood1]